MAMAKYQLVILTKVSCSSPRIYSTQRDPSLLIRFQAFLQVWIVTLKPLAAGWKLVSVNRFLEKNRSNTVRPCSIIASIFLQKYLLYIRTTVTKLWDTKGLVVATRFWPWILFNSYIFFRSNPWFVTSMIEGPVGLHHQKRLLFTIRKISGKTKKHNPCPRLDTSTDFNTNSSNHA